MPVISMPPAFCPTKRSFLACFALGGGEEGRVRGCCRGEAGNPWRQLRRTDRQSAPLRQAGLLVAIAEKKAG